VPPKCLAFERDGGQAVTCDDFRAAMADANDSDAIRTAEFGRWYSQAGTPTLTVVAAGRNSASGDYELTLSQATEPTPGQPDKLPLLLPVAVGVLVSTGADTSQATELQLRHKGTAEPFVNTLVLQLTQPMQTFVLELGSPAPSPAETAGAKVEAALPAADQRITLSVLRGWSAPVKLVYTAQDSTDLAILMAHDSDGFNRYEAASRFATKVLVTAAEELAKVPLAERVSVPTPSFDAAYLAAWGSLFDAADTFAAAGEQHLHAKMLTLPTEVELLNEMSVYDAHAVHTAIAALRLQLAASRARADAGAGSSTSVGPSQLVVLNPIPASFIDILNQVISLDSISELGGKWFSSSPKNPGLKSELKKIKKKFKLDFPYSIDFESINFKDKIKFIFFKYRINGILFFIDFHFQYTRSFAIVFKPILYFH